MRNYPASLRAAGKPEAHQARAMRRDAHAVAIVICDGVTVFELGVACDVFGNERAAILGVPWYRTVVCGITPGPVTTDSGFQILPAYGPEQKHGPALATSESTVTQGDQLAERAA